MLFHDTALCAYMFDYRFRGLHLTAAERSTAMRAMGDIAGTPCPTVFGYHIQVPWTRWLLCRNASMPTCHPVNFWNTLFVGDPLSHIGAILCGLPASQACVERTFSASDWAVDNRERLGFAKLAREVYIKVNTQALTRM